MLKVKVLASPVNFRHSARESFTLAFMFLKESSSFLFCFSATLAFAIYIARAPPTASIATTNAAIAAVARATNPVTAAAAAPAEYSANAKPENNTITGPTIAAKAPNARVIFTIVATNFLFSLDHPFMAFIRRVAFSRSFDEPDNTVSPKVRAKSIKPSFKRPN